MREETLAIRTRLERVALCADIASHYVQDMRVMPASGVARVAWDAIDHIKQMEKATREKSFSEVAALGQASDAHDAQKAAEADAASWKMASTEAELECKTLRPRIAKLEAERDTLFRKAALAEEWRDSDRQRAIDAEAKLALAVEALEQCQIELDDYSQHEYPGDHPVQARYRKRDYDANPARIALAAIKWEGMKR